MVNAQTWLNENYPSNRRSTVSSLDINRKYLQGSLKLEGFINLKKIDCSFNKITELQINGSSEIEEVRCQNNQLKELKFQVFPKILICNDNNLTSLELGENNQLERLNIMDNDFSSQDLSFLKSSTNLKELYLGNWGLGGRIGERLYNRFYGSLEFLKDVNELERLDIRNTDISSGLENLSNSVVYFSCRADRREGAGVGEILRELNKQKTVELMDDSDLKNSGFIKNFPAVLKSFKESKKSEVNEQVEIKRLRDQVGKLEGENKNFKGLNKDLTDKVSASDKELQKIRDSSKELEGQRDESRKEAGELRKEVQTLKSNSSSDNNKRIELKKKLDESQNKVDDLNEEKNKLIQNLVEKFEVGQQLTKTEDKVDGLNEEMDKTVQNSLKVISEKDKEIGEKKELEKKVGSWKGKFDGKVSENQQLKKQLATAEKDLKDLRDSSGSSNNNQTVIDLQNKIKELDKSWEKKEADYQANSLKIQQGLIAVNNDLKEEIKDLKKQVEELRPQTQVEVPPK